MSKEKLKEALLDVRLEQDALRYAQLKVVPTADDLVSPNRFVREWAKKYFKENK